MNYINQPIKFGKGMHIILTIYQFKVITLDYGNKKNLHI